MKGFCGTFDITEIWLLALTLFQCFKFWFIPFFHSKQKWNNVIFWNSSWIFLFIKYLSWLTFKKYMLSSHSISKIWKKHIVYWLGLMYKAFSSSWQNIEIYYYLQIRVFYLWNLFKPYLVFQYSLNTRNFKNVMQ